MNPRSLPCLVLLACCTVAAAAGPRPSPESAGAHDTARAAASAASPEARLQRLNAEYVRAYLESDVAWFERYLATDFRCILSSGAIIDRAAFLRSIAEPVAMAAFEIEEVTVQFAGEAAVVQARTRYETSSGARGGSRYTDVWVLRDGRWQALTAQITAIADSAAP